MLLRQRIIHIEKIKLDPFFTSYTEINSRWLRDLKGKTFVLSEKIQNILNLGKNRQVTKSTNHKGKRLKIDTYDYITISDFYSSKDRGSRRERRKEDGKEE